MTDDELNKIEEMARAVVGDLIVSDTDEMITVKVSGDPPAGRLTWGDIISAETALKEYLEGTRPATVLALVAALRAARAELARVTALLDMLRELSPQERLVLYLKDQHAKTWRDKSDTFWLAGLAEEVLELTSALEGRHAHTPDTELVQIAAIALNWLELRAERCAALDATAPAPEGA